jgi:hypothetical protein
MKKIIILILFCVMPIANSLAQHCSCEEGLKLKCLPQSFIEAYERGTYQGKNHSVPCPDIGGGGVVVINGRDVLTLAYLELPSDKQNIFINILPPETAQYVKENQHKFDNFVMPAVDFKMPKDSNVVRRLPIDRSGLTPKEIRKFKKVNKTLDEKGINDW